MGPGRRRSAASAAPGRGPEQLARDMIWYRHADPRYPFLWESSEQPPARWHGEGEGPAHYLSDTAEGAWAEYLRHEEITDLEDLPGIRRSIWAVEVPDGELAAAAVVPRAPTVLGGVSSY